MPRREELNSLRLELHMIWLIDTCEKEISEKSRRNMKLEMQKRMVGISEGQ